MAVASAALPGLRAPTTPSRIRLRTVSLAERRRTGRGKSAPDGVRPLTGRWHRRNALVGCRRDQRARMVSLVMRASIPAKATAASSWPPSLHDRLLARPQVSPPCVPSHPGEGRQYVVLAVPIRRSLIAESSVLNILSGYVDGEELVRHGGCSVDATPAKRLAFMMHRSVRFHGRKGGHSPCDPGAVRHAVRARVR